MTLKERYTKVLECFRINMPNPKTELNFSNPFQLLCAVILSAQCTDKRVNTITPALFHAFPTPQALADASPQQVFNLIRSCSYPNNKTKSLIGMARAISNLHAGQVPADMDSLLAIPGVGRKTANVILSVIWQKPTMAVDTHVFRVSERIGLTSRSKNPLQTEKTLLANIPPADIPDAHHWLILHGRYVCKARKPDCPNCCISHLCKSFTASHLNS